RHRADPPGRAAQQPRPCVAQTGACVREGEGGLAFCRWPNPSSWDVIPSVPALTVACCTTRNRIGHKEGERSTPGQSPPNRCPSGGDLQLEYCRPDVMNRTCNKDCVIGHHDLPPLQVFWLVGPRAELLLPAHDGDPDDRPCERLGRRLARC